MSEKLKPCPFCGGEKIYSREFRGILEDALTVLVRCAGCGAELEGAASHPQEDICRAAAWEDATGKWNTRVERAN